MSSILGLGRGKKATNLAMTGFNYAQNNPLLQQTQGIGADALGAVGGFLGLGGAPAQTEAFDRFRDSTGYQFQQDEARRAVTGGAAAGGLLGSGATAKALQDRSQQIANVSFGDYLRNIMGLAGAGQDAAFNTAQLGASAGANAAANQPQNTGLLGLRSRLGI